MESPHHETSGFARSAKRAVAPTRGAGAAEIVVPKLALPLQSCAEGVAVAYRHLLASGHVDHGVQHDLAPRLAPRVVGVGETGVVEARRGEEDGGAVPDVEAVGFEDRHDVRDVDVGGAVRAVQPHVLPSVGEGHELEFRKDFGGVVGFGDGEEGRVCEDAGAFDDVAGREDPLAFPGRVLDGEGAGNCV